VYVGVGMLNGLYLLRMCDGGTEGGSFRRKRYVCSKEDDPLLQNPRKGLRRRA
jgi:hypothetical protein